MRRTFWKIKRWWRIHISDHVEHFFYDRHSNNIDGPGYSSYREFKYGKLAFIISALTLVGFVLFLILK